MIPNVLYKRVGFEGSTVRQVGLDHDTVFDGHVLIALFGTNSLDCGESQLMLDM